MDAGVGGALRLDPVGLSRPIPFHIADKWGRGKSPLPRTGRHRTGLALSAQNTANGIAEHGGMPGEVMRRAGPRLPRLDGRRGPLRAASAELSSIFKGMRTVPRLRRRNGLQCPMSRRCDAFGVSREPPAALSRHLSPYHLKPKLPAGPFGTSASISPVVRVPGLQFIVQKLRGPPGREGLRS